jgi:tetratricopeptide (TPR) repeat protein
MYCNMQVNSKMKHLAGLKYFYVWVLCLFLPLLAGASAGDDGIWNKANNFYVQKQYDSAEAYYSKLLQKYPGNAMLQYNMGNTSFRLNNVGAAVLHYQKASLLDPDNKDINDNLLLAKGRVLNAIPEAMPIFFVRWWQQLLQLLHPNTWAVISLLVFFVVLALCWYARIKKEQFAHAGRWLSLSVVLLIICGCMTWFTHEAFVSSEMAVVLQPGANFMEEPRASGKVLGTLPEGTIIEINQQQGQFMNVKLPNGREGWILSSVAEKV